MAQPPGIQGIHEVPAQIKRSTSFLNGVLEELGISRFGEISPMVVKKLTKERMTPLLLDSLRILNAITESSADFRCATKCMKTELMETQQKVISLQSELLANKNDQLNALKIAVKSSVEDSVKSEFRSYSSVVQDAGN